jgi:phospholipid transport system substrate-binding protein
MRMIKTVVFMCLIGFTLAVSAQPGYPGRVPPQLKGVETAGPGMILQQGLGKLQRFMGQKTRPGQRELVMFLETEIAPYFDFDYMARWVSGPRWRYLNSEQKRQMKQQLKEQFLATLVQKLSAYGGQGYRMLATRRGHNGEVTVGIAIQNPGGYPARMKFRFYRGNNGWKVFDVMANGNSAVVHYRQHFNRQLPRFGRERHGYGHYR